MTEPQSSAPQLPPGAGIQSRIRDALRKVADEAASRSTRMAIVVPGGPIADAMFEIFSDVPRVPDYDEQAAASRHYDGVVDYVPDQVPPDAHRLCIYVDESGENAGYPKVVISVDDGHAVTGVPFDPDVAQEMFLAGLAACAYAQAGSRYAVPVD